MKKEFIMPKIKFIINKPIMTTPPSWAPAHGYRDSGWNNNKNKKK